MRKYGEISITWLLTTIVFLFFVCNSNVHAANISKALDVDEEQDDSSWKEGLPFTYNDSYSKVQNLFIYIVSNEGAVDDVEECASIMGIKYFTKKVYSEEMMDYLSNLWDIKIYDNGESISYELHNYGGQLSQSYLQYEPKSSFGLVVKPTAYYDSYMVADMNHPMNVYLRGATGFVSLQDAVDFINEYNGVKD